MRPDFPEVIDASLINEFRTCRQKCFRTYFEHWKPQGDSVHLWAGKAFATGLEATRRAFYEKGQNAEDALATGFGALLLSYGDFEAPERGSGSAKTAERMLGALEFYFNEWPLGHGAEPTVMPSGKRAIEFSFAQPLPYDHPVTGQPLIYSGRSDMICDFAGGVYVEDDKTTSQLGESWSRQWELRSQFTGYCWAARESGIVINGVLVRGVSILKGKYGSAQVVTYRSGWEIDRWLWQLGRDIRAMVSCWETGEWDYDLGEACGSYGGCKFSTVCKSPDPLAWLPMYFERKRWDPLERTEHMIEGEYEASQKSDLVPWADI